MNEYDFHVRRIYYNVLIPLLLDIDECTTGAYVCDKKATCINKPGSYACKCNKGYEGDGKKCTG